MNATMNHTEQAERVSRDTGWNLNEYATERGWSGVALGPVGQYRDSGALDLSNFQVIMADAEQFGDAVDTVSFGHWAVGWVEEIASDAGRADVQAWVAQWRDALEGYPVADDDHYCMLEWEHDHPDGDPRCYADDDDCECGRERA